MTLNWFDFGIIAVIFLSILISFLRGFLRETISIITWVGGLIVAIRFSPVVSVWLYDIIASETLRYIIAFVLLFIAVLIVGLLVNMLVKRGVRASGFSFADRLVGAVFGVVRGVLLVAVVLVFVTMTATKNTAVFANSALSPLFTPIVTWLDGFLPEQLQQVAKWIKLDNNSSDSEPIQVKES